MTKNNQLEFEFQSAEHCGAEQADGTAAGERLYSLEQEQDFREKEAVFALKLMRGMTTYTDAVEYLVSMGWTKEEADRALKCSCK